MNASTRLLSAIFYQKQHICRNRTNKPRNIFQCAHCVLETFMRCAANISNSPVLCNTLRATSNFCSSQNDYQIWPKYSIKRAHVCLQWMHCFNSFWMLFFLCLTRNIRNVRFLLWFRDRANLCTFNRSCLAYIYTECVICFDFDHPRCSFWIRMQITWTKKMNCSIQYYATHFLLFCFVYLHGCHKLSL